MGGQTGLGNFAFIDGNANGVRDEGEYGVADVVVKLLNPDGSPVLNSKGNTITTTTDNQGSYSFVGIAPGEYKVMFVAPEGFTFTAANVGGDDTKNSDVDIFKFNGITKSVVIEAGDFNDTLGAGLVRPASIGNFVFDDLNGNGFRDDNEQGIAGVEINLLADTDNDGQIDDIIRTATTNADGFYEFTGLTQGDYKVQFIQPEGFDSVSPFQTGYDQSRDSDANPDANLTSNVITLQQGYNESHADAGFYKKAPGLGGSVFIDSNANGIKDDGDFNRGDIVVKLLNPDGSPALDDKGQAITTVTDNQGNYSFFNLNPGSYQVMFVAPEGFTFTTANTGSNDAVDSDAGRTGITQTVVIEDGDFNSTLNAGLVRPASIGNFVFDDLNGNGFRDDNEQGIAGVEINLLADTDNDGQIDDILETTTTDAEGFYEFTGLTQGDYKVQFIQPEGFDSVSPFQTGYDQSRDSDANPDANLTSNVITLQQGYNESHADAGFYKKA
ncbi:MAG: SdrD B-like domain-containing protein, partial [Cyanobacteria bacterium P01_D01_bin.156]